MRPWNNDLVVDWAEQQDEPDEETMATVKVLYVKNVKEVVTEEQLKEMFEPHGEVERAKKVCVIYFPCFCLHLHLHFRFAIMHSSTSKSVREL